MMRELGKKNRLTVLDARVSMQCLLSRRKVEKKDIIAHKRKLQILKQRDHKVTTFMRSLISISPLVLNSIDCLNVSTPSLRCWKKITKYLIKNLKKEMYVKLG